MPDPEPTARRARSWFELQGSFTLRMDLSASMVGPRPPAFAIRELARDEVSGALRAASFREATPTVLDAGAPLGWRCFAAFADDELVHHSFVARRPIGWVLFRVETAPAHRRRGAFRAVAAAIAECLRREGAAALYSSVGARNAASLSAHRAAGFELISKRYDPIVLGFDLRRAAARALRAIRARLRISGS